MDQDDKVGDLLIKWSIYINEHESASNIDYLSSLSELRSGYADAIVDLNKCMEGTKRSKQKHSSVWLDDLIKRFGIDYIKNNREAVLANISIAIGNEKRICDPLTANVIYRETLLRAAYGNYLQLFNGFYETLIYEDQQRLKSRKETVEALSSFMNQASMVKVILGNGKPSSLIAVFEARRLNEEIYQFLKKYTYSPNFDPMVALDDLKKIATEQ
ncbi:MAG: hypothetical protein WAU91_22720 [Desulfatitalea sp.]